MLPALGVYLHLHGQKIQIRVIFFPYWQWYIFFTHFKSVIFSLMDKLYGLLYYNFNVECNFTRLQEVIRLSRTPNKTVNIKIETLHIHFSCFTKFYFRLNKKNSVLLFFAYLCLSFQQYLVIPYDSSRTSSTGPSDFLNNF